MNISPAHHQFLIDENKSMRELLRKLYEERQYMRWQIIDLRGLVEFYEQKEAHALKVSGALGDQSKLINTH